MFARRHAAWQGATGYFCFGNPHRVAVLQRRRCFGDHLFAGADAGQHLAVVAEVAAQAHGAALGLAVVQDEDDVLFAVLAQRGGGHLRARRGLLCGGGLSFSSSRKDTRTPMSGTMRGSFDFSAMRTFTVALARSAVGMIAITSAGILQSG